MANIKMELSHEIIDGQPVTFVAPCDCTEATGLKVYYPDGSKEFTFKDAHGNDLTGIGNLFSEGAYVKAILDVVGGNAYLQNADTNMYLEANIIKTYIHSEGKLVGSGVNGKFKATVNETVSAINVNGASCSIKCGEEDSIDLVSGCWYTFILDGSVVNFNKGGAGGGINLKVVSGTSAPSNPKENTIWVNTSTTINGYIFSATEPTNPVEGMLWCSTGASSTAPMNIDKKNTVMLYPVTWKQYINGAWVRKIAKTYLNGAWADWMLVLWDYGDNTVISGGWGKNKFSTSSTLYSEGSVTVNADGTVTVSTGKESDARGTSYTNLNLIDMTPFSTMAVYVTGGADGWYSPLACFGVTPVRTGATQWTARKAGVSLTPSAAANQKIVTVDISNVNEPCYVLVAAMQGGGAADSVSTISYSKIELY